MKDLKLVQSFQPSDCLYEDTPYLLFLEELLLLFVVEYLLVKVTVICKLHHDAELL